MLLPFKKIRFIIQLFVTSWNLVEDYTQYSMALMFLHYLSIVGTSGLQKERQQLKAWAQDKGLHH